VYYATSTSHLPPLFLHSVDNIVIVIVIVIDDVVSSERMDGRMDGISSGAINATPTDIEWRERWREVDKVNCETRDASSSSSRRLVFARLKFSIELYLDRAAALGYRFAYGTAAQMTSHDGARVLSLSFFSLLLLFLPPRPPLISFDFSFRSFLAQR